MTVGTSPTRSIVSQKEYKTIDCSKEQYAAKQNGSSLELRQKFSNEEEEKNSLSPEKRVHVEIEVGHKTNEIVEEKDERETWNKKADFLLSVIGFAVDLGNIWRFPTICYKNGGGAFLIPYFIMYLLGGLPLFYMELALGQYQRCGCISIWKNICPLFKGVGFGICVIASYVAMYYNTIIAWALYYLISSFQKQLPWTHCNNTWNTPRCRSIQDFDLHQNKHNPKVMANFSTSAEEFFELSVLEINKSTGLDDIGTIRWSIALCLLTVFIVVYFSLWKGIKTSGKVVWITATLPYFVLLILLLRGMALDGSATGISYYLYPQWEKLGDLQVWIDAASQVFFSLGPGFGVLMALSSYNKFNNNCYRDALVTSGINCMTSFLAGFVVFSVLGYIAAKKGVPIDEVAKDGAGLVFVVYPEAIATLWGSSFWVVIFFLMLITLGLDSTFGGLEALITGLCDEWPFIKKHRKWFVALIISYCFMGALTTTTNGGNYVLNLLDQHGPPIAILLICFCEVIAVSWFYGVQRFCSDIERMNGHKPGIYWRICWTYISPTMLIVLFIMALVVYEPMEVMGYTYPPWARLLGWCITFSSVSCIPMYFFYRLIIVESGPLRQRLTNMTSPENVCRDYIETTRVYV